jgi:hypothetical protein
MQDAQLKQKLMDNIDADLAPWKASGIDRALLDRVERCGYRGLHIKIIDGRVEVLREVPSFQTRNHCIILMLRGAAARYPLPDCEFIIHTDDIPPASDIPLFTFCKRHKEKTILFPDWSFYSWPEALVPGVDEARRHIARGHCSWDEKIGKVFFTGAATHPLRKELATIQSDLLDIRITDWSTNRQSFVTLDQHNRWKYLVHLPGRAWSARLKYLFMTNSLVIQADPEWREFWHPILDYGRDCICFDFGKHPDVSRLGACLEAIPEREASDMALRGRDKVCAALTLDNVYEYISRLITEYAKLIRFRVKPDCYKIVIARYNEDVSWSDHHPRVVYNKGSRIEGLPDSEQIMLPNVGRESHTYLSYMIDNYNDLPDFVLFTQGSFADHSSGFPLERYLNPDCDFIAGNFCNAREWDDATGRLNHHGPWLDKLLDGSMPASKLSLVEWFDRVLYAPVKEGIYYSPGAVFWVSSRLIRKRHVGFYKKLREYVERHSNPEEGHYLERSWLYIFAEKDVKVLNLTAQAAAKVKHP